MRENNNEIIRQKINQRRRQIIVHSVIYYRFNDNIIDDHKFDMFCKELVELQEQYPAIAEEVPFHEEFKGFDGSTGFHLTDIPWGVSKAEWLLNEHKKGR